LQQPQRDGNGEVIPHNHNEILNEDPLIRRITALHIVPDENRMCRRISSKAFQPSSQANGGMSVDIKRLIVESGKDPVQYVVTKQFIGSVAFTTSSARNVSLLVGYDPLADNPHHGEVWGNNRPNRFSKAQQNAIWNDCEWFVEIPDVALR
jgi:hypothetical protein